jgi:hypothetical protein
MCAVTLRWPRVLFRVYRVKAGKNQYAISILYDIFLFVGWLRVGIGITLTVLGCSVGPANKSG